MFNVVRVAKTLAITAILSISVISQQAFADDWVAVKLRGNVFALDSGSWVKLSRGDVISDNRSIRTTRSGRAEFVREKESITIGGDTQISIADRNGQRYTVVHQQFGKVEIEAERRNVKHFAVQTPYLAAVVKGTRFVVQVSNQRTSISVSRGTVNAVDRINGLTTNITPGQTASSGVGAVLAVVGPGAPAVTKLNGKDTAPGQQVASNNSNNGNGNSGNGNGNSGNSGGNGNNGNGGSNGNGNNGNGNGGGNGNGNNGNGNNGNGNNGNGNGNGGGNGNGNNGNGNGNGGNS